MPAQKEMSVGVRDLRGSRLSVFLFGVLTGGIVATIVAAVISFGTNARPFIPDTIDRMFVIKVALSASAILVTIFALVMTFRSQVRQRKITYEIDKLYEKMGILSNH
jgi:hypothetical protein